MEGVQLLIDYLGGTALDQTIAQQLIALSELSVASRKRIMHRVLTAINFMLATSSMPLSQAA